MSVSTPPEELEEGRQQDDSKDIYSFKLKGNLQSECTSHIGNSDQKSEMDINSELQTLRTENMELRQELLPTKVTRESFDGNDKKVQYMTGLPSLMTLIAVFGIIEPHLSEGVMSSLSKFQKSNPCVN